MFKLRKTHKVAGIFSGVILFVLAITGIVLDHDEWTASYRITLPSSVLPSSLHRLDRRLFVYYDADIASQRYILAGYRGIYVKEGNKTYHYVSDLAVTAMIRHKSAYYAATLDGIWRSSDGGKRWEPFALRGEWISALSTFDDDGILAVKEKHELIALDKDGKTLFHRTVGIDFDALDKNVTLARLVRDVHYGRGLIDGKWSLWWNDAAAVWLAFLAMSGYVLYFLIRRIRHRKSLKKLLGVVLKWHTSWPVWVVALPLLLLGLTGIVLDHSAFFGKALKRVRIDSSYLPPVYHTLRHDIWSVDYFQGVYRIGNRYGVYRSKDLKRWSLESEGFAYKMMRRGERLYVSGMGAPSRVMEKGRWQVLQEAPHMFRSVTFDEGRALFLTPDAPIEWPREENVSLYSTALALHDGSFFSSWWVYINDIAALGLFLLLYTGTRLWLKRIR